MGEYLSGQMRPYGDGREMRERQRYHRKLRGKQDKESAKSSSGKASRKTKLRTRPSVKRDLKKERGERKKAKFENYSLTSGKPNQRRRGEIKTGYETCSYVKKEKPGQRRGRKPKGTTLYIRIINQKKL